MALPKIYFAPLQWLLLKLEPNKATILSCLQSIISHSSYFFDAFNLHFRQTARKELAILKYTLLGLKQNVLKCQKEALNIWMHKEGIQTPRKMFQHMHIWKIISIIHNHFADYMMWLNLTQDFLARFCLMKVPAHSHVQ